MADRLEELRRTRENIPVSADPVCIPDDSTRKAKKKYKTPPTYADKGAVSKAEQLMMMPEFYRDINDITAKMAKAREHMAQIEALNRKAVQAVGPESSQFIDESKARMDIVDRLKREIRDSLKAIEQITSGLQPRREEAPHSFKLRCAKTASVKKSFLKLLEQNREAQDRIAQLYRQDVTRQYLLVHPNATRLQLNAFLQDEPDARRSLFSDAVKSRSQQELQAMQSRLLAMQYLHKSIQELAQMYQDMQEQVAAQQSMIDRIETVYENIEGDVEHANKDMEVVKRHQRKKQRLKIIAIVAAVVVVLLILGSVLVKFAPLLLLARPATRVNIINSKK